MRLLYVLFALGMLTYGIWQAGLLLWFAPALLLVLCVLCKALGSGALASGKVAGR